MPILDAIDRALYRVEYALIAIFTIGALCLGVTQVILRYVFNSGISWSEAIFVLLTNTGMLLAGSLAVREDKHVRVDLIYMFVSERVGRVLLTLSHLTALALCCVFVIGGVLYVRFVYSIDSVSPDTEIPDWIIYLLVPITMGLFALRYTIRIVRTLRGEESVTGHAVPQVAPELEGRS